MNEHDLKYVEEFRKAIEPNISFYKHTNFSYLALKQEGEFHLTQARLEIQVIPPEKPSSYFESESIRAGIFQLSESGLGITSFIGALLSGKIETPHGLLRFIPESGRSLSAHFTPYFFDAASTQRRQIRLTVSGGRRVRTDSHALDWELKAAPRPFFNIQELCDEFAVGVLRWDSAGLEATALPVAVIAQGSAVDGTKARINVDAAEGLQHKDVTVGYRIFGRGSDIKRGVLNGETLSWSNHNGVQRGTCEMEVPAGAVVDCIANVGGVAQQHAWIRDPKTSQNPLRSVHEAFDSNLNVLRELVERSQKKNADARDLEMAVAWLLWLLGFSTTHIGGTGKTSDAPDLIAATPQGHLVVVECTTGILKEDSKLPHLIQRSERVRQHLVASGNQHIRVLPILVTTKTRDEVKIELEQAHKHGVLVATREDFDQVIERTVFLPDPTRLFTEGEETLRRLQNPSPFPTLAGLR